MKSLTKDQYMLSLIYFNDNKAWCRLCGQTYQPALGIVFDLQMDKVTQHIINNHIDESVILTMIG